MAAHSLRKQGWAPTVFSPHLHKFGKWLEPGHYVPHAKNWTSSLEEFDAILLQHDNTARARLITSLRKTGRSLFIFYTNYRTTKHDPLDKNCDFAFDETKNMVENTKSAIRYLFNIESDGKNTLSPLAHLQHQHNQKRILIHPTSTVKRKNWSKQRFLRLSHLLKKKGHEPAFILSPQERSDWPPSIFAPHFETLEELASFMYQSKAFIGNDSGPAHLASYLSLPSCIVCEGSQMPLWSPGWHPPTLLTPPRWVPNIKGMRLRETKWKYFIPVRKVLNAFEINN